MTNPEDDLIDTFSIIPDHPWQERYGGVYSGVFGGEIGTLRYALRLLTDRAFEAAENARLGALDGGPPLPAIPEVGRAERIARLTRDLAAAEARWERKRLGPG